MAQGYHPQQDGRWALAMPNHSNWNNLARQDLSTNSLIPPLYPQYTEQFPVSMLQDPSLRSRGINTQRLQGGGPNDVKFDDPTLASRLEPHPSTIYPHNSNTDVSRFLVNDVQKLTDEVRSAMADIYQAKTELGVGTNELRDTKKLFQNILRQMELHTSTIAAISQKVDKYMKFLSAWMKEFSQKVDPIMARMAGDSGHPSAFDVAPSSLEANIEDDPAFRGLFNS